MLDRVDDDGLVIDLRHVEQSLYAQYIGAMGLRHHIERPSDFSPFQRLVEIQRETMNVVVVAIHVMSMPVVMTVPVPVLAMAMIDMALGVSVGFFPQPLSYIGALGEWVVEPGVEKVGGIGVAMRDFEYRSGGINGGKSGFDRRDHLWVGDVDL